MRSHYLLMSSYQSLDLACRPLAASFDFGVYLVGSCMSRPDFRDVDVRAIIDDSEFAGMFPSADPRSPHSDPRWSMVGMSISIYLSRCSDLPVDFQVQQFTAANAQNDGQRSALGLAPTTGRA